MNYCCRDDYGATTDQHSAWAGIQYFASREPEEKGTADLAGGERLDRPPPARARWRVRTDQSNGAPNFPNRKSASRLRR